MQKILIYTALLVSVFTQIACKKDSSVESPRNNPEQPTANALLANPQKGNPITTGKIDNFTFASKGKDMALVVANNTTGKIYAIDIQDNDASQAAANAITSIDGFKAKIAQKMGLASTNISIVNMELNPISKAVYVLVVKTTAPQTTSLFKVTKGSEISLIDLSNVSYSAITFSTNNNVINNMIWGENEIYVSMGSFSLNGEFGKINIPFTHNDVVTKKSSTIYHSSHRRLETDAPLEKIAYGKINGVGRLMGVTTCEPGFSIPISEFNSNTATLKVNTYFDLGTNQQPNKVIFVTQGTKNYLILHSNNFDLFRIGQSYIDGTKPADNNATFLLDISGTRIAGLTDDDVKIYPNGYSAIAKYNDNQVLVLDNTDKLSLLNL